MTALGQVAATLEKLTGRSEKDHATFEKLVDTAHQANSEVVDHYQTILNDYHNALQDRQVAHDAHENEADFRQIISDQIDQLLTCIDDITLSATSARLLEIKTAVEGVNDTVARLNRDSVREERRRLKEAMQQRANEVAKIESGANQAAKLASEAKLQFEKLQAEQVALLSDAQLQYQQIAGDAKSGYDKAKEAMENVRQQYEALITGLKIAIQWNIQHLHALGEHIARMLCPLVLKMLGQHIKEQ